jgi:alkylation response protein AidB-like acyl-CoA dehydrogenase
VGRIATRATRGDDGRWRVTGGKIFITFGDQDFTPQIAHLLLARTPDAPPGTRGLSLFVVPSRRIGPDGTPGEANGVTVTRVEHKMGLKGSPTCVMSFDNSLAYPVGAPGAGMRCMFTMVNTMRLEVAMQGVAVAGAATARALAYAAERRQGGPAAEPPPPLASHPDVRSMLLEMRALTEGFRAVVLQTAALLDLAHGSEDEGERRRSLALAEWLLPVGKAAGSEAGFRVANLAVQVFGGHGYISDSGVEQYVRDARVMAIYEGANGIQAIDLVTRKLGGGGERLGLFVDRVMADLHCHRSACPSLADALEVAVADLRVASDWLVARLEKQPRDCEAGARAYLELVAVVTLGWMWLRMAGAAPGTSLADTKLATALFVGEQLLPVSSLLRQRVHAGARTLDALALEELCRYPE